MGGGRRLSVGTTAHAIEGHTMGTDTQLYAKRAQGQGFVSIVTTRAREADLETRSRHLPKNKLRLRFRIKSRFKGES